MCFTTTARMARIAFFEVECGGEVDREEGKDSKLACTEIKVKGELSLAEFVRLSVKTTFERAMKSAKAATSGWSSSAATSGWSSSAVATGCKVTASAMGKDGIAVANGAHSKARGVLGCYLVLTEYDDDGNFLWAKMAHVDGSTVKENVWYTLKNGEFVEAEQ